MNFAIKCFFLDPEEYAAKFGASFTEDFASVLVRLKNKGLVQIGGTRTVMTPLGIQWKMNVLLEFIDDDFWGDQEAVNQPNWAMNTAMIDLTAEQHEFWLVEHELSDVPTSETTLNVRPMD